MISLGKIVASLALASVLAAGSAYALLKPVGEQPAMRNHFAVPFTQGFATRDVAICATGGTPFNVALTFENRWDGQWRPMNSNLGQFTRTSCPNIWAQGYFNSSGGQPLTVASLQTLNLSTLPLMR